jgi:hypothetical protein
VTARTAKPRHRVIHYALVDGRHDHLNLSLTEGNSWIRGARKCADVFHSYDFVSRDGAPMHVVYALYRRGSSRHGFAALGVEHDITYWFEVGADAVTAAFGLAPRGNTAA